MARHANAHRASVYGYWEGNIMAWVRLDDDFADHPKIAALGNDAFCLHVTAMCYAARQRTDGKLSCDLLKRLAWRCHDPATAVAELVTAGVWDIDDEAGWIIHDYLDYNPSKSDIDALAATRREAGKAGASARWQNHSKPHSKPHSKYDGKTMPPSPSDDDDKEYRQAVSDMQTLGLWTTATMARFEDMWPELSGRRDWVGKAITITRDKDIGAGIEYALKILANAIHTGKEPGYTNSKETIRNNSDNRPRVPAPSSEETAAADARQAAYERETIEQLTRAGRI